jgi:hypothetical protein
VALDLQCSLCGDTLNEPGALLFGPPGFDGPGCTKDHFCTRCFIGVRVYVALGRSGKYPELPARLIEQPREDAR